MIISRRPRPTNIASTFASTIAATVVSAACVLALTASGAQAQPAGAQQQPRLGGQIQAAPPGQTVTPGSLAGALQNAERTQNADNLLLLYGQAVTTPELARAAIGQLLSDYYGLRAQAQTADQATQAVSEAMLRFMVLQTAQNQILVQQNQQLLQQQQRIIELLEAQNRRGPANAPTRR